MRLVLKNIGLLQEAEIELAKLSVIAGENDNGKSTIGKVMFCLVKAINRYKEDFEESKEYKLDEEFRSVFFFLRNGINNFRDDNLRKLQNSEQDFNERLYALDGIISDVEKTIGVKKTFGFDEDSLRLLRETRNRVEKIINKPENTRQSMENALNKVFASEFDSRILLEGEKTGFIGLYEQDISLIEIQVFDDNKVHLRNDVEPVILKDATFIETPLILNNHDMLIRSKSAFDIRSRRANRLGVPYTTFHTKDLFDKLIEPPFGELFNNSINKLIENKLHQIVSGEIIYDNRDKDFVFKKDEGSQISIKNTASGIKVFGILQLLSSNDFITKDSLLVFDEPENHLHPKWQLKLAEILVSFAEYGVYILVSSHSPYMIEALKRYSDNAKLKKEARFYLSQHNRIENQNKLEEIFKILSEPFETFRNMDREILKDE